MELPYRSGDDGTDGAQFERSLRSPHSKCITRPGALGHPLRSNHVKFVPDRIVLATHPELGRLDEALITWHWWSQHQITLEVHAARRLQVDVCTTLPTSCRRVEVVTQSWVSIHRIYNRPSVAAWCLKMSHLPCNDVLKGAVTMRKGSVEQRSRCGETAQEW
ncbi:hypothetical protein PR002_g1047 [Phytophthora rubi]|uniref:Uncharacterized protein n=1 Tax=Phytophthora rubi TaxID=129364 RepID=A0A6A3NS99_9STRA|nr:hypothetical protein PR002_g1047 [Phytophthora rubi]